MPAPVAATDRRDPRLLSVLFWIGVALAPVAALILLVADGNGPLRFAAVLTIFAVVLIGLSIALRADGDGGHGEAEELRDEIDRLGRELRGEIVAAAQRSNQALDASQRAQEQVAALRRRLDAAAAGFAADPDPPSAQPAGAGRARIAPAETYADAGRPGDAEEAPAAVPFRASARPDDAPPGHRPQPIPRHGTDRPAQPGVYGTDRPAQPGVYGTPARPAEPGAPGTRAPQPAAPDPVPRPVGLVRHTETVHVTTRHTVVDGPDPAAGGYGDRWSPAPDGYGDGWSPAAQERPWAGGQRPASGEPEGRPWAGHADPAARVRGADAHRFPDPADPEPFDDRAWARQPPSRDEPAQPARPQARGAAVQPEARGGYGPAPAGGGAAGRYETDRAPAYPPVPATSGQWSEAEAGDRWAEVRDDDRGREVRVGERRATAHADATGSGYRVEDRWAAVRQGDPYPEESPGDRWWDGDAAGAGSAADRPGGWPAAHRDAWPAEPAQGAAWSAEAAQGAAWSAGSTPRAAPSAEWRPPAQREAPSAEQWGAAEPEPARLSRHQRVVGQRYGHASPGEPPRAGGARPADHWR
ncbi:hypothetical protein [Micromonospora sp. NPDC002575]|uniref:hypothetical protein n=1 Tax=Micromonospora sp. NPDC002575 TaxID=3364222 RepID=UPI0036AC7E41